MFRYLRYAVDLPRDSRCALTNRRHIGGKIRRHVETICLTKMLVDSGAHIDPEITSKVREKFIPNPKHLKLLKQLSEDWSAFQAGAEV